MKAERDSKEEMSRERARLLYIEPRPIIPFKAKHAKVTPSGFVRCQPTLA